MYAIDVCTPAIVNAIEVIKIETIDNTQFPVSILVIIGSD
jgi:hypothetical protein